MKNLICLLGTAVVLAAGSVFAHTVSPSGSASSVHAYKTRSDAIDIACIRAKDSARDSLPWHHDESVTYGPCECSTEKTIRDEFEAFCQVMAYGESAKDYEH